MGTCATFVSLVYICLTVPSGSNAWIEFMEETGSRLIAEPARGINDAAENDFALGDLDKDGDFDIVVMRKQEVGMPCNGSSLCQNQLLMNEGIPEGHPTNGIFVDRTLEYATAATDFGQGFMDITSDRDVALADVNGDTWLDIITSPAVSEGLPKTISHPRVYVNKGEIDGVWQGFIYEEQRIPQLLTIPAGNPASPRLCAISARDVSGDGAPDIYLGDYDGCATCPEQPGNVDLNDRLLINDGTGFFVDSLYTRMSEQMLSSGFVAATEIVDMNNDGVPDVVRNLVASVTISYNSPFSEGFFTNFDSPYNGSAYHVSTGDLNQDGMLDLIVTDDGPDRYLLNTGNGGDGMANFETLIFGGTDGFGGNSITVDLNNDSFNDVIITDFDAEFTGCGGRMHIYHNLGNLPMVTLQEEGGQAPWTPNGSHDVVAFDINGDQWQDLFIGTCTGHEIWINKPPFGVIFEYPNGLPAMTGPDTPIEFGVSITAFGNGGEIDQDSATVHFSVDNNPFVAVPLAFMGGNLYQATLPAAECGSTVNFYVSAELQDNGGFFTDPLDAPDAAYGVSIAAGTETAFFDDMESDTASWSIVNDLSLSGGAWMVADPNPTIAGVELAAPDEDATPGDGNVQAFVTENGLPGGAAGASDVDGGPTRLISPTLDLAGTDAVVSFAAWFFSSGGVTDNMTVAVSNNDGASWIDVMTLADNTEAWQHESFTVGQYVTPTSDVRVRFAVADSGNDSITEGGIDDFKVDQFVCYLDTPTAGFVTTRYVNMDVSAAAGEFALYVVGESSDPNVACVGQYVQQGGTLGEVPVYRTATQWGQNVTFSGQVIVPGKTYNVHFDWGTPDEPLLGPPAAVTTAVFGDVDDNEVVNFADVLLVVQGFQDNFDNVTVEQADLAPCTPNAIINFEDILLAVQAFQGVTFEDTNCSYPCGG